MIFGVIGEVGEIGGQRIACPLAFERVHPKDPSEKRLWQMLLGWVHRRLAPDQVAVMDAGVKLADVHSAQIERYLLRLATNFTARRNQPLHYEAGKGRKAGVWREGSPTHPHLQGQDHHRHPARSS